MAFSGDALERINSGFGRLLEMWLFQYRINEAFAVYGFPPVLVLETRLVTLSQETCNIKQLMYVYIKWHAYCNLSDLEKQDEMLTLKGEVDKNKKMKKKIIVMVTS